jgi:hypothetical protein
VKLAAASTGLGAPMRGVEAGKLAAASRLAGRGA